MNELDVRYQLNRVQEDALRYGYTPILEYFNPDNNRLWKLFQEEGLELLRANMGRDDGIADLYYALKDKLPNHVIEPTCLVSSDHKQSMYVTIDDWRTSTFSELCIRHKDAPFYNAIVGTCFVENDLGTPTKRYYVASPFINKQRSLPECPSPYHLFDKRSLQTNDMNKAIKLIMGLPHLTFIHLQKLLFHRSDLAGHAQKMLERDLGDYIALASQFIFDLRHDTTLSGVDREGLGSKAYAVEKALPFVSSLARIISGDSSEQLVATAHAKDKAIEYLAQAKVLQEDYDETANLQPVYVMQMTEKSPVYCFMTAPEAEPFGYYYTTEVPSKLKAFASPYEMPHSVKGKIAAVEINKEQLTDIEGRWEYLSGVGAKGGEHADEVSLFCVALDKEEIEELFGE